MPPLHGVVVIALPDHAADGGRDSPSRSEPAALRRAWRLLRLATAPLVVLAAFAVAAHCYGLYSFSFSGGDDWKWGEGRASSFLLPLHPKPKPAGVKAEDSTTAVLPERCVRATSRAGTGIRIPFAQRHNLLLSAAWILFVSYDERKFVSWPWVGSVDSMSIWFLSSWSFSVAFSRDFGWITIFVSLT